MVVGQSGGTHACFPSSQNSCLLQALLQMVCDESRHILALSECCTPASAPSEGKPHMVLECILREAQGLLEAVPQKGEKVWGCFV